MPSRARKRAELAAALEYAPQMSALTMLLGEAKQSLDSGLAASRSAATGVARSAKRAIKPTRQAYKATRARADERQAAAVANIAQLGEAAAPFQASSQSESALAAQLAADAQRSTVGELRQRAVDARTGAAHDARALRGQYQSDVMGIARQMQALSGQQGAATARYFGDFLDDAADRRHDRAELRERRRHNLVSEGQRERQIAGDGRGRRWLSQADQTRWFGELERARVALRSLTGPIELEDGTTKTLGTGEIRDALVSRGFHKDLVNSAFDLEKLGRLSRPNVQALHRMGLRIGRRYRVEGRSKKTGRAVDKGGSGFEGW